MKRCLYCKKPIEDKGYGHKIGDFCHEAHFDAYYASLTNEELVQLMTRMCVCSDEGE